jgi:hypothetical protein
MSLILSFHPPPSQPVAGGSNIGEAQVFLGDAVMLLAAGILQ